MDKDHRVIVMSGSMKFFDDFLRIASELSMQGYIVLLPFKDPRGSENIPDSMKKIYDSAHRQRIQMADEMYVVNKDGYIGKSTHDEIKYALYLNKPVHYLEDPNNLGRKPEINQEVNMKSHKLYDVFDINCTNMSIARDLGFKSVTTICGSMKYYEIMEKEQARLSSLGHLVYLPPKNAGSKCKDIMHSRIAASDSIYVINKGGYIGDHTKENIAFAASKHKEIQYYDEISETLNKKIITLCGSRKFIDTFKSVYRSLTLMGNTVLTPSVFDFTEEEVMKFTEEEHRRFDENHRRKIDISDIVFIVNPPDGNGHIGDNTREEINYARSNNKMIVCMSDRDQNGKEILG